MKCEKCGKRPAASGAVCSRCDGEFQVANRRATDAGKQGVPVLYRVFVRNWWKRTPSGGREPGPGRKTTIARGRTEEEARRICQNYNATHNPGFLSRKAEYDHE